MGSDPQFTPVADLQTMLRTIFPDSTLTADGIYGTQTQGEVQRFQREHALPVTGITDQQTYGAVKHVYAREAILLGQAAALYIVLQPAQVLSRGSNNTHLYLIQALLLAMGRYYAELPPLTATGILDEATAAALVWFQEHAGLPTTGEVDKITWLHLAKQYRLIVGDGSGTFPVRTVGR